MEPRDKNELFVADDIIKTAKELQTHLSGISYDEQPRMAVEAMEVLGDPRELYGGRKLFVHALGARILRGEVALSFDEEAYHGVYLADAYLKGEFSRFAYVRSHAVAGLCLSLVETKVLESKSNPEFNDEKIQSGMYIPIHAVEMVLSA